MKKDIAPKFNKSINGKFKLLICWTYLKENVELVRVIDWEMLLEYDIETAGRLQAL